MTDKIIKYEIICQEFIFDNNVNENKCLVSVHFCCHLNYEWLVILFKAMTKNIFPANGLHNCTGVRGFECRSIGVCSRGENSVH